VGWPEGAQRNQSRRQEGHRDSAVRQLDLAEPARIRQADCGGSPKRDRLSQPRARKEAASLPTFHLFDSGELRFWQNIHGLTGADVSRHLSGFDNNEGGIAWNVLTSSNSNISRF
jgi:hypothetical protein